MPAGAWQKRTLRYLLEQTDAFVTCVELVTARGQISDTRGRRVLSLARELAQHPGIDALSITDNPGGNAMIGADVLGTDLIARGQDVIIHLTCKDGNRNALQSRGWQLASAGFNNVLALTGDYPTDGYGGLASGVFDLDSVALLEMFSAMNAGLPVAGEPAQRMAPTNFFLGAVVNNYKRDERELMPQYFKLVRKINTGARFIINQIGFDARKQDELLKYLALRNLNVAVLANVYVLSAAAARHFHAGKIPGCVVTSSLLELCERHAASADRGKAFFLEFAAKQCAVAKGLGFRGVYLGGHIELHDYLKVLAMAASFAADDWKDFAREFTYAQPGEFYYFEPDAATGLSSDQVNQAYLRSTSPPARAAARSIAPLAYKVNRAVHHALFTEGGTGFALGAKAARACENTGLERVWHGVERTIKSVAFDCRDCGDCALPEIAYLCPESQCAKNQRNGPCGGTRQGKCEVGDKDCIWSLAYDRLKPYGEEETMLDRPVVLRDGHLRGSSAWANAFLGRDHRGKRGGA